MSEQQSFDREVASWIALEGEINAPGRALDDILNATSRKRPLPRWLALIKEPPMRISSNVAIGSPTQRVAAIIVATTLIALMAAGAGSAGSRLVAADGTIVVDQSGNGTTTTITEAVEMAMDGETILVRPGTYDESIVLAKDVTIRGDGDRDAVVVEPSVETPPNVGCSAPDLPTAFVFERSDATLENLTLRGESARIIILGGAPLLRDLVLDGIGRVYLLDPGSSCVPTGLDINEGSTATIRDSLMSDMDIDIESGSSPSIISNEFTTGAIWMQGTGVDPIIRGNVIEGSVKWGISIGGGARPTVESNTITGAATAIEIEDTGWAISDIGTDPVLRGNTISGSTRAGVSVGRGATATIEENELIDNSTGISLTASDAAIEDNAITGGQAGITIVADGSPTLTGNTVEGVTARGIAIADGSPTLTGNVLCGNGTNLWVADDAEPTIVDSNEICEVMPDGAGE